MKKNSKYLLFCILIVASGFINAQVIKKTAANKTNISGHNRTIDSLQSVLKTLATSSPELKPTLEGKSGRLRIDTTILNTFNALSRQYKNTGNFDAAMYYARRALDQGEKLLLIYKDEKEISIIKKGIALAYNSKGVVYRNLGNYESGLDNMLKSLKINEEIGYNKGIASSYNNVGLIYWNQGYYEKAIESFLKSLKIKESMGDNHGRASSLQNIGLIYMEKKDYENSLKFYFDALKMNEGTEDKIQKSIILNNIGDVYNQLKNDTKALEYILKSIEICEEIGDKRGIADSYNSIGEIYFKQANSVIAKKGNQKEYGMALDNFLKSLAINLEIGIIQAAAINYINIGKVYLKQNKLSESSDYITRSLTLCRKLGYKVGITNAYSALSELSEKKGDFKHAFEYKKLFSAIKDSLLNEQSGKQIAEMSAKYDSEKKDKAIQLLSKENESHTILAAAEARKQQVILFSVSVFSLLLLVFATIIYRSFRQKQLLNKELEKLSIVASETDNGVLICGPKGELEWCNAGLTRLLGYSLEEMKKRGNTLEEVSVSPEIKFRIQQSIASKKSTEYQVLNITKDGRERWMQSTLTPILDAKGNIKKLVVIDTDVSERRMIEEKLSEQNTELEARTVEIKEQKKIVEQKNLKIVDSITYARLIQQSILMEESEIQHFLPNSFIYYQPKDIVSGDFYWFSKVDDKLIIAAIDCTGHGVPGAFMSMIGNTLMNQIVNEKRHTKPSEILRLLNLAIYEALHQQKGETLSHDGMDMALCSIDYKKQEIQYSGAQNPLYIVCDNNLEVIDADVQTIGGGGKIAKVLDPMERTYTNHIIPIKKGMSIYLFSDGFMDQFGEQGRKKFGMQQFKTLLLNNQHMEMWQQKEQMVAAFEDWQGTTPQIDDVLVMGLRL